MYSITGWSKGARVPITYNLRAGQSRGMDRVNRFPTVINNYFEVEQEHERGHRCCNNNNDIPKWTQWFMGLGIATTLVGNILGISSKDDGDGGSDVEGAGGKDSNTPDTPAKTVSKFEAAQQSIKTYGKEYSVKSDSEGNITYVFTAKDGTEYEGKTLGELNQKILDGAKKAKTENEPKKVTSRSTPSETVPNLFKNMNGLTTTDAVLSKFKEATGAGAVKISDLSGETITLDEVVDKGNGTSVSDSLNISVSDLKGLQPNGTKKVGTFHGKDVVAENVDGYIRVTVGTQSYIVGKDDSGKYKGYQFENGNVTGYNSANWPAPPPEETHVASTNKTHKASTKKTENKTANTTKQTDTTQKAETFKASYTVTMKSGNKCYLKIDQNNKYRYFDKSNNEITASEYQKQTGQTAQATMNKINKQNEVNNWNKQHPQNKVTLKNGKYTTIVNSNLGNTEISANSFDELKNKVYAHLKKANAPANTNKYTTGGYGGLGKMMQH